MLNVVTIRGDARCKIDGRGAAAVVTALQFLVV